MRRLILSGKLAAQQRYAAVKNTKIVNLGQVRDLLAEWEKVRAAIMTGKIDGWFAAFRDTEAQESIYMGGVYKEDPQEALKAALRVSAARTLIEDEPSRLKVTGT